MRYILLSIVILSSFYMLSCNSDGDRFYKTSHVEDIDVLPLIKPYKLWTPVPNQSVWHLDFQHEVEIDSETRINQMQVCNINVSNNVIYGHCMGEGYNGINAIYFVVDMNDNTERAFKHKEDWAAYLQERGVDSLILYDVLEVYNAFKADYKTLPWYNEIKRR